MFSATDFGETTPPGGTRAFIPGVAIYIGEPETLEILEDLSCTRWGAAFAAQPKLRVVDAGNTVTTDETSLKVATRRQRARRPSPIRTRRTRWSGARRDA